MKTQQKDFDLQIPLAILIVVLVIWNFNIEYQLDKIEKNQTRFTFSDEDVRTSSKLLTERYPNLASSCWKDNDEQVYCISGPRYNNIDKLVKEEQYKYIQPLNSLITRSDYNFGTTAKVAPKIFISSKYHIQVPCQDVNYDKNGFCFLAKEEYK